jgi:hypothetical protein
MKRIYLSGAVSSIDYLEARARFDGAEALLKARGYSVVNPLDLVRWRVRMIEQVKGREVLHLVHADTHAPITATEDDYWRQSMVVCFEALLKCDALYLLNNWRTSRGARIELAVAVELGLEILIQSIHAN